MVLVDDFIRYMEYWSVADLILPFILVFTVVFAALQKSKIMGEEGRRFNGVIALVMAMGVVVPHVLGMYPKPSVVDIINASIPQVSLILVVIVMFLIIVGVFGKEVSFAGASLTGWAIFVAAIALVLIFGSAAGWFAMPTLFSFLNNPEIQSLVVIILVFGIIIWFVTHDPDDHHHKSGEGLGKFFSEMIKK